MAAFENEKGELTDDAFEKSEILRRQYESVASVPMKEFEVNKDSFAEDKETTDQENMVPLVDVCDHLPLSVSALTCCQLVRPQVLMESPQQ